MSNRHTIGFKALLRSEWRSKRGRKWQKWLQSKLGLHWQNWANWLTEGLKEAVSLRTEMHPPRMGDRRWGEGCLFRTIAVPKSAHGPTEANYYRAIINYIITLWINLNPSQFLFFQNFLHVLDSVSEIRADLHLMYMCIPRWDVIPFPQSSEWSMWFC